MPISLSVIIPAHNSAQHLERCLEALCAFGDPPLQIIVVDDGSTDGTKEAAAAFPVTILTTPDSRGPAFARNLGARAATADVLVFLDSDVRILSDTLQRIRTSFEASPDLDALIGSYDSSPHCHDFLSQYRNLMHAFVHQTGAREASTFWSGCGAIRRSVFIEHSGFDEAFGRPAIEDIELGYRLVRAKRKIVLDRDVQVTHLKRWTFWSLVKTDILDRGIPWTELILRDRFMPNDLNLQLSQRVSSALAFILVALSGFMAVIWRGYFMIPLFLIVFVLLARWWVEFGAMDRPRAAPFILFVVVMLTIVAAYWYRMFGLIPPLMLTPVLLFMRHRYAEVEPERKRLRTLALVYMGCSVGAAVLYLPAYKLIFVLFIILATLGLMNSQFYIFLAGKRGIPFMLAAMPFHLLYHFYNGLSFVIGLFRYLWTAQSSRVRVATPPMKSGPARDNLSTGTNR